MLSLVSTNSVFKHNRKQILFVLTKRLVELWSLKAAKGNDIETKTSLLIFLSPRFDSLFWRLFFHAGFLCVKNPMRVCALDVLDVL